MQLMRFFKFGNLNSSISLEVSKINQYVPRCFPLSLSVCENATGRNILKSAESGTIVLALATLLALKSSSPWGCTVAPLSPLLPIPCATRAEPITRCNFLTTNGLITNSIDVFTRKNRAWPAGFRICRERAGRSRSRLFFGGANFKSAGVVISAPGKWDRPREAIGNPRRRSRNAETSTSRFVIRKADAQFAARLAKRPAEVRGLPWFYGLCDLKPELESLKLTSR